MPDVTLDHLTLDELRKLQKAVTAAIRRTEKRRKRGARAPKYVHPENPTQTWSGRGRRPRWVTAALAAGWTLEDLLR